MLMLGLDTKLLILMHVDSQLNTSGSIQKGFHQTLLDLPLSFYHHYFIKLHTQKLQVESHKRYFPQGIVETLFLEMKQNWHKNTINLKKVPANCI